MFPYLTITQTCISCDLCAAVCPESAIVANAKDYFIDSWSCTLCLVCIEVCPVDCIKLVNPEENSSK
ncbi:MAG: 4Fe-4S binding protein [Bacteriovoracaceae bacterium]